MAFLFPILLLSRSLFPNFGQGPFPKIAGKGPVSLNSPILGGLQHDKASDYAPAVLIVALNVKHISSRKFLYGHDNFSLFDDMFLWQLTYRKSSDPVKWTGH